MKRIEIRELDELFKSDIKLTRSVFTKLIEQLIIATVDDSDVKISFPNGNDGETKGVDGFVINNKRRNVKFVPFGDSVWEIGTGKNASDKIKKDYEKRKNNSDVADKNKKTYVGISSQIMNNSQKNKLITDFKKDKIFKDVNILDLNDLTEWLNSHFSLYLWLLKEYGKIQADDICLVEDEIERFVNDTNPPFETSFFTKSNETNGANLINELIASDSHNIYSIFSSKYGDKFALYFALTNIKEKANENVKNRCLILRSREALDYCNSYCDDKILIIDFNNFNERSLNTKKHTYIVFDNIENPFIKLNAFSSDDFRECLKKMKYGDEEEVFDTAYETGFDVFALYRLLCKNTLAKRPAWYNEKDRADLKPLALLNQIDMDKEIDISFLQAAIGSDDYDSYIDKLNYWFDRKDSPIIRFKNIYKIKARKECLDYLFIGDFDLRLKRLEDKLICIFSDATQLQKYGHEGILDYIFDGFIILSEKTELLEHHFMSFVKKLYAAIGKEVNVFNISRSTIKKIAELSPRLFLVFLDNALRKAEFVDLIKKRKNDSYKIIASSLILWLEICLKQSDIFEYSFNLLLKIYDLTGFKEYADEIDKVMTPTLTLAGYTPISLTKKNDIFYNFIRDKDFKKYISVVCSIYKKVYDPCGVFVFKHPSYRKEKKTATSVSWEELAQTRERAWQWLFLHSSPNEFLSLLENIFSDLNIKPEIVTNKQIAELKRFFNQIEDDELKQEIYVKTLYKRQSFLFADKRNNRERLAKINRLLKFIAPKDNYEKSKYILLCEIFPLDKLAKADDKNEYRKNKKRRDEIRKKTIAALISEYGRDVIRRIVKDCYTDNTAIWPFIYELSDDRLRDVKQLIKFKRSNGLKYYLQRFDLSIMKKVLDENGYRKIIIENLPYNSEVFKLIEGCRNETYYWRNYVYDDNFDLHFDKLLKYAPWKALDIVVSRDDVDSKQTTRLLKAITAKMKKSANFVTEASSRSAQICELIDKIDSSRSYSRSLIECELYLYPYLQEIESDYFLGIKYYFWNNPKRFAEFLADTYKNSNNVPRSEIQGIVLKEVKLNDGERLLIPRENLIHKKKDLLNWVRLVLAAAASRDNDTILFIKEAIVKILVLYPQTQNEIWPPREIADALELLAKENDASAGEIIASFINAFSLLSPVREAGDGTEEQKRSDIFTGYSEYYSPTHPVVSQILEWIAHNYRTQSEGDKERLALE